MKKLLKNRFVLLTLSAVLLFVFLFLSFFALIIVKSDLFDLKASRMNVVLLGKDLIFFLFWLCLIPLIIYCFKKYRQGEVN